MPSLEAPVLSLLYAKFLDLSRGQLPLFVQLLSAETSHLTSGSVHGPPVSVGPEASGLLSESGQSMHFLEGCYIYICQRKLPAVMQIPAGDSNKPMVWTVHISRMCMYQWKPISNERKLCGAYWLEPMQLKHSGVTAVAATEPAVARVGVTGASPEPPVRRTWFQAAS